MHNHIPELDELAERLFAEWGLSPGHVAPRLRQLLADRHGVLVEVAALQAGREKRQYDAEARRLWLPDYLEPGQQAFQMAAELALHGYLPQIDAVVARAGFTDEARIAQARIGLSNYFAGALVMPYMRFLRAAEASSYDIELLAHQFGVGFEAVCHRLSTLAARARAAVLLHPRGPRGQCVQAPFGHRLPLLAGGWFVPAVDRLRGVQPARAHPYADRAHARWATAFLAGTAGQQWSGRPWPAAQDVCGSAGLRPAACRAVGVFTGAGCRARAIRCQSARCRVCPREDCMQRAFAQLPGR